MTKAMSSYQGYVFTIEYDFDPPGYIVEFPDFPDIITSGSTLSEAFSLACEALDLYLASLKESGMPLPAPRHHLVLETSSLA